MEMVLVSNYAYTKCSLNFLKRDVLPQIQREEYDSNSLYKKLRQFQHLYNVWQYNFRYVFIVTFVFLFGWETTLAMFVVVKFQDLSALKLVFATLVFYSCLVTFLGSAGAIYSASSEILQKWKALVIRKGKGKMSRSSKCLLKQLHSMHPIQFCIGTFYTVTGETWLSVTNDIINTTVTLLFL